LVISFAGADAEGVCFDEFVREPQYSSDRDKARRWMHEAALAQDEWLDSDTPVTAFRRAERQVARRANRFAEWLNRTYRPEIERIADELDKRGWLSGRDIRELMDPFDPELRR
jgi:hypothetical protein